ncbi:MAG: PD40 domain-containing protein [Gemmatimonadaceae bacterium]|nr:PD40 domain-containing protein [Gemmatimonadaceae bacterium]
MRSMTWRASALLAMCMIADAAAAQAPGTDVFLAPLRIEQGVLRVGAAVNVTNRPGYDNQPAFLRDNSGILFTSIRDDAQADIYRYDLRTRAVSQVTMTPESEYSATPLADGASFSVVRVEADSTQRLWRFPLGGGAGPTLLVDRVKPVGYHTWIDDSTLAMFVLGTPATLQIAHTRHGDAAVFARGIGRGLQPVPGARGVTYARQAGDTVYIEEIRLLPGNTMVERRLARALPGQDYFVYTPAGELLAAAGNTLYRWSQDCRVNDGWERVGELGPALTGVTRLAVSPDGRWLAFVADPVPR